MVHKTKKFQINTGIDRYGAGVGHYLVSQKTEIVEARNWKEVMENQEKFAGKGRTIDSIIEVK